MSAYKYYAVLAVAMLATAFSLPAVSFAEPIPADQIGSAAVNATPGLTSVATDADGIELISTLQAMKGKVTSQGLTVTSVAKGEPGQFSLTTTGIGRDDEIINLGPGAVSSKEGKVTLYRYLLSEEFTASGDGITQDFVIPRKLGGAGRLHVQGRLTGAKLSSDLGGSVTVTLASGRDLVYDKLSVSDASGKKLPAYMKVVADSLSIFVDDSSAEYPIRIDPTITDSNWQGTGGIYPGADSTVSAFAYATSTNILYVGGAFSSVAGVNAGGIASWNGSSWSALGTGLSLGASVFALAFDPSGAILYVGGNFTTAGGTSVGNIAKWNGSAWSTLQTSSGASNSVAAIAVASTTGDVYIGGSFTSVDSVSNTGHIARWNGSSWNALGTGVSSGNVNALAFATSTSALYAGGGFTTIGGVSAARIARWNGAAWSPVTSGVLQTLNTLVYSTSTNILYVGGQFTAAGGIANTSRIAKWSGTAWSALGTGAGGTVNSIALDAAGNLYAGGAFSTMNGGPMNHFSKWDGSTWSAVGSAAFDSTVSAVAVLPSGTLYAGGSFSTADGTLGAMNLASFNGSTWGTVGSGFNKVVNALAYATSTNILYVGGNFTSVGGIAVNHVASWNGSTWSALGSGVDNIVYSLALNPSATALYAGGGFTNSISRWDIGGSSWSALGSGLDSTVYALAFDSLGNLYAGGNFVSSGATPLNYIGKWDGSTWSSLAGGMNFVVNALVIGPSNILYAGGNFNTAGVTSVNDVASWNGSSWSALGAGVGLTYALVFSTSTNTLYAGGSGFVSSWNGSTWTALGSVTGGATNALAIDTAGALYAGGLFTTADGVSANAMASWNGSSWSPLGSGVANLVTNAGVRALLLDPSNNLYVGGDFTVAGITPAANLAKLNAYYFLTYTAGSNGTLSGSANQTVGSGSNGSAITAVPNSNYHFAQWSDASTANPRMDTSVTSNQSFTASFTVNTQPTVTTDTTSSITDTLAILNGSITAIGSGNATQHGLAYGTSSALTTVIGTTTLGSQVGTGSFSSTVSSLTCGTTYYVRAYATNASATAYGSIASFTTTACPSTTTTTPAPAPVPSPGGGSTSGQAANLRAIYAYNHIPYPGDLTSALTVAPIVVTAASFPRSLTLGNTGQDIKALQAFLNTHGFAVSASGAGSSGHESITFGPATKAALMKFQKAYAISPTSGYFGVKTKAVILELLKGKK